MTLPLSKFEHCKQSNLNWNGVMYLLTQLIMLSALCILMWNQPVVNGASTTNERKKTNTRKY